MMMMMMMTKDRETTGGDLCWRLQSSLITGGKEKDSVWLLVARVLLGNV